MATKFALDPEAELAVEEFDAISARLMTWAETQKPKKAPAAAAAAAVAPAATAPAATAPVAAIPVTAPSKGA